MLDVVVEKIDAHTKHVLEFILHSERRLMNKFDELSAAFSAMIAAQTKLLGDFQTALQTSITNSGADASHFDGLIAQVNDATKNLQAIDATLTAPATVETAPDAPVDTAPAADSTTTGTTDTATGAASPTP